MGLFNIFKKETNAYKLGEKYTQNEESILSKLNIEQQKLLKENGFIKFRLLDQEQVDELLKIYYSQPNAKREDFGFHVSLDIQQNKVIETIASVITKIVQPFVDKLLDDYQFISPRFAVKEANHNSLVPPHQDWSFVDETNYQSYNLWIALTPSRLDNGTLGFLPKSHNKLKNIRATPLPLFKVPFHDYAYDLLNELDYFELEPGEAFLFNSRVIHASKPNISSEARINIAIEITNKSAQLTHYNLQSDGETIHEYLIDHDFFSIYSNAKLTEMYKNNTSIDSYKINRTFKYKKENISKKQLLS